jgi:hypothetical protein
MQNIFLSKNKPEDYVDKHGVGKYPEAPKKCPYGDCGVNIEMKKHGYYTRMLITITFTGKIRIRRYKCRKCGRTLSMLPSFCIAGYTYSLDFIIVLLKYAFNIDSIKKTVRHWITLGINISRRLISKYLKRLCNNRRLIQYGINQISPEKIIIGRLTGDTDWTKSFVFGMRSSLWQEFNNDFHKTTGKSFMSLHNSIA